jgi:hypothetical protein
MSDLTFFPDPAVDRVLGVVMELAQEVYALRQKLGALEGTMGEGGTEARDAFVARILVPLTYESESPTPEFEAP